MLAAALALVLATGAVALVRRAGALEREVARRLAVRDLDGARRLLREAERAGAKGPSTSCAATSLAPSAASQSASGGTTPPSPETRRSAASPACVRTRSRWPRAATTGAP
jgi:hypothetical protein